MKESPAIVPGALEDEARVRWWVILILLGIGVAAWLSVGRLLSNWANQLGGLGSGIGVLVLAAIPTVRRVSVEGMSWLSTNLEKRLGLTAIILAIVAAAYFTFTAIHQERYLHPYWHDELSYVLQMRMLARGRLWMPLHPCAEFFETFYVLNDRVYASIYFPGTALLYVPEIWLHLPLIAFPICAAGAAVGLVFWVLAKLVDPVAALVGAMLMIGTSAVRTLSIMVMSNIPVLIMGLLLVIAFLQWQKKRQMIWALAMGFFAGWAAVCRPLEATCFAVPVGIAILLRLRDWNWSSRFASIALVLIGAAPFLTLQVVMNYKITGDWRVPPWQYYSNRDFPQTTMGFREFDPAIGPISNLPQKQLIYENFVPDVVAAHQPHLILRQWMDVRFPALLEGTMPYSALVIFLPLGIPLCRRRWRWVLAGALPVFIFLYGLSVVFQDYYPVAVIGAVLLLVLLGMKALAAPFGKGAPAARALFLLWAFFMAIAGLPEAGRHVLDRYFEPRLTRVVDEWEKNLNGRALVFFRFNPNHNLNEEPVFNTTTAWPDDAKVVRAHDLGDNRKLVQYYAKIQPDRQVFMWYEGSNHITALGTAGELAK